MISRQKYIERIQAYIDKPVIKVITGIRRCGKSTFMRILVNQLIEKGVKSENIVLIKKDSLDFEFIKDYNDLHLYVKQQLKGKKGPKYIFIDEVQEVSNWEKAVAGFLADNMGDIYISGSNARMLSSELSTLLSGRYIEFNMFTLTFSEFLSFRKKGEDQSESEFKLYMKYGGFPGLHHIELNDEFINQYLNAIYNTVLLKDVVARNQVRDVALLEKVFRYIADNCGNITTAKSISNYIKSQHLKCSVDTIQNYISWLTDANIIHKVNRYDIKGKRQLEIYEKYFMGDIGFLFSTIGNKVEDISGKLENIVYLELISRGYSVQIGKLYDKEIDFIATKNNKKTYIQVCYLLNDQKVIDREFGVFNSVKDNYEKLVLSLDKYSGYDYEGIQWMNLLDFLLENNSLN
ncbi:MAG: ATPase [Marinilabiliales bacterium]|nr:MAG: ATPase [Marinilabiliales bacterium]